MGDAVVGDLVRKMRSGRISRRHFIERAGALGLSATAISSALRANPARAQGAGEVTFWTTHSEPDLSGLQEDRRRLQRREQRSQGQSGPGGRQRNGHHQADDRRPRRHRPGRLHARPLHRRATRRGRCAARPQRVHWRRRPGRHGDSLRLGRGQFPGQAVRAPLRHRRPRPLLQQGDAGQAGIDTAPLDVANGAITFDALAEIANQLNKTDQDGNFSYVGFVPYVQQGWHYTYGFAFGGTFFDYANCEVTPDEAGVVAGSQWVYDYCKALDPQKLNAFAGPFAVGQNRS